MIVRFVSISSKEEEEYIATSADSQDFINYFNNELILFININNNIT